MPIYDNKPECMDSTLCVLKKSSVTIKEAIIIMKIPSRHKGKQLGDSKQGSQEAAALQLLFAVQPPPAELLTLAPT